MNETSGTPSTSDIDESILREDAHLGRSPEAAGAAGSESIARDADPAAVPGAVPSGTGVDDPHQPGTPAAMTPETVDLRSRIAAVLTRSAFPGDRADLLAHAEEESPDEDRVLSALRRLPEGRYERVQDVADALGLGHEDRATDA